jgi:aspartate ammonia-lyase
VVDPYQAGAGTSHNMNVNEVLANRANELLGAARGSLRARASRTITSTWRSPPTT